MLLRKEPELLLIATSVRALLESASRGAYACAVIDGFRDRDVVQHALCAERVGLRKAGGLDDLALAAAIERMCARYARTLKAVVVGAGLEACRAAFKAIEQSGLQWLGNGRSAYQSARRSGSTSASGWVMPLPDCCTPHLYKSAVGSGGVHICRESAQPPLVDGYYCQRYMPLSSISHLFLAADGRVETVGFSTQWHSRHDVAKPFYFGGAINAHDLNASCIAQAEAIAATFALEGLNNIDYLYDGRKLYFLELNPRPSATIALYDADYPRGLLHAHIKACQHQGLERCLRGASKTRAFAILYAHRPIRLAADFDWPQFSKDVPVADSAGYSFAEHSPICTLSAQADTAACALSQLQKRLRSLYARIDAASLGAHFQLKQGPQGNYNETSRYSYQ